MSRLSRSTALKIAAVLSFFLGLYGLYLFLPLLPHGADSLSTAVDSPPYGVVVTAFVFAIVRIVAAYGVWRNQRWGILLTILANTLDGVGAVPGILFAPTTALWRTAVVTVILALIIVVLCLWRDRKPAGS